MISRERQKGGGRRPRLRTGFLLVVLLGAILPLGVLGLWLARSAQRSAEALVRTRVETALGGAVSRVGTVWPEHRSQLLRLAHTDAVISALTGGQPLGLRGDAAGAGPDTAHRLWTGLDGVVHRAVLRDPAGEIAGVLERDATPFRSSDAALLAALIPVRLTVHRPATGEAIGTLEAWVRAAALLPGDLLAPGVTGAVLALFDPSDGSPLLPLSMDPSLFARARFDWGGESWAVAHHRMYEPSLVLALAGPMGDLAGPYGDATRHGTLALLAVALAALLLTSLVSRRLTRPLDSLAQAADDVAGGRLDHAVPEDGPEEVQRVARAFNHMTASLRGTLERLSHQETLAAMGQMAASLAHEVRNPLTAIRIDLERANERLPEGDPVAVLVRRALRDIERLDTSVTDTLGLARSGRVEPAAIALAEPLAAAVAAAAPRFAERGAVLEAPTAPDQTPAVMADATALEQLFLNLLLNAADALPPGGRAGVNVEVAPETVKVVVWDEGEGMTPETRDRVLEPFFSTRSHGTGLGLPIANGIARAHGESLHVASEPGQGTRVTVTLRPTVAQAVSDRNETGRADRSESGHNQVWTGRAEPAKP
jgi:signal transduction histidine kinase